MVLDGLIPMHFDLNVGVCLSRDGSGFVEDASVFGVLIGEHLAA
jgi:hypothetical protein